MGLAHTEDPVSPSMAEPGQSHITYLNPQTIMLKRLTLALVALLLPFSVSAQEVAENDPEPITIGESHSIHSEVLGEERPYWIYLPASYSDTTYTTQHYPVLYLLDGDSHFHWASGLMQQMSRFHIPEMIIVALPNTNRIRDLTPTHTMTHWDDKEKKLSWLEDSGGADSFLEFIGEELFNEIESTFRTQPYRILVGHSLAGLFTLHALLDAPEMFQAYVAMDPSLWWDDQLLVHRADSMISEGQQLDGSVYISLANEPDLGRVEEIRYPAGVISEPVQAFAESLESVASSSFRPKVEFFEAEVHDSVQILSLYHGLMHIFEGYSVHSLPDGPRADILEEPSRLKAHFENISYRLGINLPPPDLVVQQIALDFIEFLNDEDSAIKALRYSPSFADHEYRVFNYLGWAYTFSGEADLARNAFEKALELNPENEFARAQLEALRSGAQEQ